jgi:hypothetical protein
MIAIAGRPLHVALWADDPAQCQQLATLLYSMLAPHTAILHSVDGRAPEPETAFQLHLLVSPGSDALRQQLFTKKMPLAILHGNLQAQAQAAMTSIAHHAARCANPNSAETQATWRWYCTHCDEAGADAARRKCAAP